MVLKFTSKSIDIATKIFTNQSSIQIENTVTGEVKLLNPLTTILRISSDNIFTLFDEARGESTVLGRYVDIIDIDDIVFNNFDAVVDYLAGTIGKPVGDVFLQDQHTDIVDYFIGVNLRTLTLAATAVIDAYILTLVSTAGMTVGNYVGIQQNRRSFQAEILQINGNIITLDSPMDYPFTTECYIYEGKQGLNLDGSVTPIIARLKPRPGTVWDITRITISMTHAAEADDGKFGGIPALTRGIVIRKSNGIRHTIFNAKTNGQLRERCQSVIFTDKAPGGIFGTNVSLIFSGQENNGVVIRLDGNEGDQLEFYIQDNLIGLTSLRAVALGHLITDR